MELTETLKGGQTVVVDNEISAGSDEERTTDETIRRNRNEQSHSRTKKG